VAGWPIKGAMHPEMRIAAKSPAMRKVVVYFVEMIAPSVDNLQYFLSWYLRVLLAGYPAGVASAEQGFSLRVRGGRSFITLVICLIMIKDAESLHIYY